MELDTARRVSGVAVTGIICYLAVASGLTRFSLHPILMSIGVRNLKEIQSLRPFLELKLIKHIVKMNLSFIPQTVYSIAGRRSACFPIRSPL